MSVFRFLLVLAVAVTAAAGANAALLSLSPGRTEPVGKLTPVVDVRRPSSPVVPTPQPPSATTTSTHGEADD